MSDGGIVRVDHDRGGVDRQDRAKEHTCPSRAQANFRLCQKRNESSNVIGDALGQADLDGGQARSRAAQQFKSFLRGRGSSYFPGEFLGPGNRVEMRIAPRRLESRGWERSAELAAALFGFQSKPNTEGSRPRSAFGVCALPMVMRSPPRPLRLLPFRSVAQNARRTLAKPMFSTARVFRSKPNTRSYNHV